jgi:prepilin-type N-terminal cleavage/methylation domain-containing protein
MYRHLRHSQHRRGFTLVEILVVIVIIGVLVVIGVGAGYRVVASMRVSSTENAMRYIQKVMDEQWNQVIEEAKQEQPSPAIMTLANGDPNRARVMWIKLRLFEAFPQNYAEIRNANTSGLPANQNSSSGIYGGLPGYGLFLPNRKYMSNYFTAIPAVDGPSHDTNTESSACLLMALSVTRGRVKLDEGNLAGFIADTDGDLVRELVDRWGNALHFQRWWGPNPLITNAILKSPPATPMPPPQNAWWVAATLLGGPHAGSPTTSPWSSIESDLAQMNPRVNTPKEKFGDPIDPEGLMQQLVGGQPWYSPQHGVNGNTFAGLINHPFPAYKTPSGIVTSQPYYAPFIFSIGPNDPHNPSTDPNTQAPYFDTNTYIFSYRLKIGSQ